MPAVEDEHWHGPLSNLEHLGLEKERQTSDASPEVSWEPVRKFWRIGHFADLTNGLWFGLGWRLDKNQATNCFELTLTKEDRTIAYMLVEVAHKAFALRGINVYDNYRGLGLSSLLVATWLKLCWLLGVSPSTKKIDKPVISLVLQKFGFQACNRNTTLEVRAESGENGEVVLWSADLVKLRSTFAKRYLKAQNMLIIEEKPERSRTVSVNTIYELNDWNAAREQVANVLEGKELRFYTAPSGHGLQHFLEMQIERLPAFLARRSELAARVVRAAAPEGGSTEPLTEMPHSVVDE